MGALLGSLGAPPFRSFRLPLSLHTANGPPGTIRPSEGHPGPAERNPERSFERYGMRVGASLDSLLSHSSFLFLSPFLSSLRSLEPFFVPRLIVHFTLTVVLLVALLNFCLFGLSAGAGLDASSPRDSCQSPTSVFPSTLCRLKPASSSFPVIRIRIVNVSY